MLTEIQRKAVPKTDGYTLDFSQYLIRDEYNVLRGAIYYFDGYGRPFESDPQRYIMVDGPRIFKNEGLIELRFEYTSDPVYTEQFGTEGSLFFETEEDLIKYLRRQG